MRVVCEKCRSAYAVDDAMVPSSGVRSQCPRCRHIQLAKIVRASGVKARIALPEAEARQLEAAQLNAAVADAVRGPPPLPDRPNETVLPGPGPEALPAGTDGGCTGCGKALTDPFDQALGSCDACRHEERERTMLPADLFDGNEPSNPGASNPTLSDLSNPARPTLARPASGVMTAARTLEERVPARWPWWVGGAVALGLGAAFFLWHASTRRAAQVAPLTPEVTQVLARFRADHAQASEAPAALLAHASERLLADRAEAYAEARALFEQLLSKGPLAPRAVAGFAEAVALAPRLDPRAASDAALLLDAVKGQGEDGLLDAARAELVLSVDDAHASERARALAQTALGTLLGKDVAWGQLALGRASLESSGKLAAAAFTAALTADPAQRRGYVLRAQALESVGDYRGARADLQTRLALDPDHWPTLDALARIELDGGEVAQAALLFQRAKEARPSDLRPVLALAELHLFEEDHPEQAVTLLQALLKTRGNLAPSETAAVQAHLAAAYRAQGMLTLAAKAVATALEASHDDPTAHLEAVLIALDRKRPADAVPHLAALKERLAPGVAKLLEGRVRFAQGDLAGASEAFLAAVAEDPHRNDALLWAGVANAAKGDRAQAEALGLKVAQETPFHLVPDLPMGPHKLLPAELLQGAEGEFSKLGKSESDVTPELLEGVVRYHQGDLGGAQRSLRAVTALDGGNVLALSYLALVEQARKDPDGAEQAGAKAAASGRQSGLAHYAYGVALVAAGKADQGKRELLQAKALAPSLLAADYQLALLEETAAPASAQSRLEGVLAVDPTFGPARRALYRLEKE